MCGADHTAAAAHGGMGPWLREWAQHPGSIAAGCQYTLLADVLSAMTKYAVTAPFAPKVLLLCVWCAYWLAAASEHSVYCVWQTPHQAHPCCEAPYSACTTPKQTFPSKHNAPPPKNKAAHSKTRQPQPLTQGHFTLARHYLPDLWPNSLQRC